MTTFADGVYQFGGIPVGGLFTPGKAFFVRPSSGADGNSGRSPNRAFKTLAKALEHATADSGDVVYLIAESNDAANTTDYLTSGLDWNKDGVHLVGINAGQSVGQRSRIATSPTALDIEDLFTVSANNCLIANISVYHGVDNSSATAPRAVVISGSNNHIINCQFSGMGDATTTNSMDVAGARSFVLSGNENYVEKCYIGLDTLIRATATAEAEVSGGSRNIFRDCMFASYTSNASMNIVTIGATVDRFVKFENCTFYTAQNVTSAVNMTGAFNAAAPNGVVLVKDCMFTGFTNITAADNARVRVLGLDGLATSHLISIAQGVDVL